jgi:hypothetical protein
MPVNNYLCLTPALFKGEGVRKAKSSPCATAKAKAARGWRGLFIFV